jgi:CxxC motif-containing protein (DUF1111 family)
VRLALAFVATLACTNASAQRLPASFADALATPLTQPTGETRRLFEQGRSLFNQPWSVAPSIDNPERQGVGPLYNRLSCIACHMKNGRGAAPDGAENLRHMVVRLSLDGHDAHGGPIPHPVYGGQLNPEGVQGARGEGWAYFEYEAVENRFADGERVELRKPKVAFRSLAYGPIDAATNISVRNAPPVFGLGLLARVPESALRAIAAENGGRLNAVWSVEGRRITLGRFGLKANQPSLRQQNANAFVEDLGITSSLFPTETCTAAQTECRAAIAGRSAPELSDLQLSAVTLYIEALAPPSRRVADTPEARAGEALFRSAGCASCHRESLPLDDGTTIAPYTDLALHDLGDGLSDGREDFAAGPRDWRTAPLWGLGLAGKNGDGANYLHDGRARNLVEAILWHGGEAQHASDLFRAMSRAERDALIHFLNSL